MKTKNRYKRYRIVLFIGLLSFHALSSCVNTGGQLGIDQKNKHNEKGSVEEPIYAIINELEKKTKLAISSLPSYTSTPWYKKPKYVWGLGVGAAVTLLAATTGSWYYLSESGFINDTVNNPSVDNNGTKFEISSNNIESERINQRYVDTNTMPETGIPKKVRDTAIMDVINAKCSRESMENFLRTEDINNTVDNMHRTLLMQVAQNADPRALQYLISRGAIIDRTDKNGFTALIYAAYQGKIDNFQFLLQENANPFIRTNELTIIIQ